MFSNELNQFLEIDGHRIRYQTMGHGTTTIVLIHGLAACIEHWYRVLPTLAQHYRVIAVDLLGHGFSDKPRIEYTIDYHLDIVEKFLTALNLQRFILLGHSFGGGLALKLVLDERIHPDKLILVNNAGLSRRVHWSLRLLTVPLLRSILIRPSHTGTRFALSRAVFDASVISDELVNHMYQIFKSHGLRHALLSTLKNAATPLGMKKKLFEDSQTLLAKLSTPTLIIWGDRDIILPLSAQQQSFNKITCADIKIFKNCGHLPYLEIPNEFIACLRSFISH